jgi:hypothetical protein
MNNNNKIEEDQDVVDYGDKKPAAIVFATAGNETPPLVATTCNDTQSLAATTITMTQTLAGNVTQSLTANGKRRRPVGQTY